MSIAISGSLWLNLILSVGMPMLVAVISKQTAHPGFKAILLLACSAASGFFMAWQDAADAHHAFDLNAGLMQTLVGFGMAVLAHYGLLSPMRITGSGGAIQVKLPGGLGSSRGA
jgi:hypothetical protein